MRVQPEYYRQEGEMLPFTVWAPLWATVHVSHDFFQNDFREVHCYFRKKYGYWYWNTSGMHSVAHEAYEKYQAPGSLKRIFRAYQRRANLVQLLYKRTDHEAFYRPGSAEVLRSYQKLFVLCRAFWEISIFIDSFDAGYDEAILQTIAKQYGFTDAEVLALCSTEEMSLDRKRTYKLLSIIRKRRRALSRRANLDTELRRTEYHTFRKEYDYTLSSYATVRHTHPADLKREVKHYIENPGLMNDAYRALSGYRRKKSNEKQRILQKHHLSKNPLWFFSALTCWREHRKATALMSVHLFNLVLMNLSRQTGIPLRYVGYLNYDEVECVLRGGLRASELKGRCDNGVMVVMKKEGYDCIVGRAALNRKRIHDQPLAELLKGKRLNGQCASPGIAHGKVRVVLSQVDFKSFRSGEVLVTGMTRPEFLPIIKKSAAIITNDGGVTCHAAITARELGIPCVIGTKIATKVLKDGDRVEVNATRGIVKKL